VAKISRKSLKRDEIGEELADSVNYLVEHRKVVIITAVLALVIGSGLAFYLGHRRTQIAEARKALQAAIELFHGRVDTEPHMGIITFTTTIERRNRTTEAFEGVKKQFPGTPEADASEYYLALLDMEQGKYQEAQPKLESAIQSSDKEFAALARLALAEDYQNQDNKDAEVKQQYQYLIDHPTTIVPKGRSQLALARYLSKSDPAQAKQILDELIRQPGVLGGAASAALGELSGA
jgi:predicted negative regulator of RcsB-dependent stress response